MEPILKIKTPRWCVPLLAPRRYKGAKGGRGSGKSHFYAELMVEEMVSNADLQCVCIREIQRSLKFSAKKLLEDKIESLGVQSLFECTMTEIRRVGGRGIVIFQGMQDHTAESIKSLEGFDRAWVEEAQAMSKRSIELLLPTIRKEGSEIWFSWNPENEDDPVEKLFSDCSDDFLCVHVNFTDNHLLPDELRKEAERHRRTNPDTYDHVWLGGFVTISDAQVFRNKFAVEPFEVDKTFGSPYHGMDFGFANDPTTATQSYIKGGTLYIRKCCGKVGLELDHTAAFVKAAIPEIDGYSIRADSARPESISYLRRHGLSRIESVKKWPGSVEDGISFMKSFDRIVIHPECEPVAKEFRLYSHKVDPKSGDIVPDIVDDWNHYIDSVRYALSPMIKNSGASGFLQIA